MSNKNANLTKFFSGEDKFMLEQTSRFEGYVAINCVELVKEMSQLLHINKLRKHEQTTSRLTVSASPLLPTNLPRIE